MLTRQGHLRPILIRRERIHQGGAAALSSVIAGLSVDVHTLAESPHDLVTLAPETGLPILAADKDCRFFETRVCINAAGSTISHTLLERLITWSMRLDITSAVL
jgi:hypothetical protein